MRELSVIGSVYDIDFFLFQDDLEDYIEQNKLYSIDLNQIESVSIEHQYGMYQAILNCKNDKTQLIKEEVLIDLIFKMYNIKIDKIFIDYASEILYMIYLNK